MADLLARIRNLVGSNEVRISSHGYEELATDRILVRDVIKGVLQAVVVEEYPDYPKGPCLLVLQEDSAHQPIHVVWGIPRDESSPAVLVTAYRPDANRWTGDFMRRKP